ncbi:MAG: division/cell wall cluster transcriptional repressor MraZ, partial [Elusimicrobiota bacterium]
CIAMFEGKSITVMDQWGRARIPVRFLRIFEERCGRNVFVTSLDERNIMIFPMSEWDGIASRINRMSSDDQALKSIMRKMNLTGLITVIDKRGRVLIHKDLRRKTKLKGRISIAGEKGHLILKRID